MKSFITTIDAICVTLALFCSVWGYVTNNHESMIGWAVAAFWMIRCKITESE
jgi:hypothetical protein